MYDFGLTYIGLNQSRINDQYNLSDYPQGARPPVQTQQSQFDNQYPNNPYSGPPDSRHNSGNLLLEPGRNTPSDRLRAQPTVSLLETVLLFKS